MNRISTITRADWGPALHHAARSIAAILVAVYAAGFTAGAWIHHLNDTIAAMLRPAPAPVAPPAMHPLAALAAELEQLTVKELQALVGTRRKLRKAELIATLCVC